LIGVGMMRSPVETGAAASTPAPPSVWGEPELRQALRGDPAWAELVREREWWRRTSVCERVGHCATTPVTFLPMPGDVRVCVHMPVLALDEVTAYVLLEQGDWFEQELSFVRRLMTPDTIAVDIGANHGVFCLAMARRALAGAVWAFEPASATADLLETSRNANLLPNLHVVRAAVSDAPGVASFVIASGGSEYSHLAAVGGAGAAGGAQTEQVVITTLDECMARYGCDPPSPPPPLVLSGHAASLTPYARIGARFLSQAPSLSPSLSLPPSLSHALPFSALSLPPSP
jgi:FkbM family methyltransferase